MPHLFQGLYLTSCALSLLLAFHLVPRIHWWPDHRRWYVTGLIGFCVLIIWCTRLFTSFRARDWRFRDWRFRGRFAWQHYRPRKTFFTNALPPWTGAATGWLILLITWFFIWMLSFTAPPN